MRGTTWDNFLQPLAVIVQHLGGYGMVCHRERRLANARVVPVAVVEYQLAVVDEFIFTRRV